MKNIHNVSAHRAYLNRRHFGSLDGIRAIAILGVLWHHTMQPVARLPLSARGFLGVDLFFVMSGFLIVTLLLREQDRNGDISLKKFYMRRTLRIFPVYYAVLAVLLVAFGVVFRGSETASEYMMAMPFYLTYTSNFIREETLLAVAWSLATEEQFYLVWPPLEKWLSRYLLPIMVGLLVINQLINFRVILAAQHARLEVLQSTFTPILLGVVLAHALHSKDWYDRLAGLFANRWATVVSFVVMLLVINFQPLGADISGFPRLLIHLIMTVFLAACVLNEQHALAPVFQWSPFVRIGQISYGMYLFHMFVVAMSAAVLSRIGLSQPIFLFVATLIGTVIVAELSFRFYEKPFLRLKGRWSSHNVETAKKPLKQKQAATL